MEIIGTISARNNRVFIKDEEREETDLFSWFMAHGFKDKLVRITITAGKEQEDGTKFFVCHE